MNLNKQIRKEILTSFVSALVKPKIEEIAKEKAALADKAFEQVLAFWNIKSLEEFKKNVPKSFYSMSASFRIIATIEKEDKTTTRCITLESDFNPNIVFYPYGTTKEDSEGTKKFPVPIGYSSNPLTKLTTHRSKEIVEEHEKINKKIIALQGHIVEIEEQTRSLLGKCKTDTQLYKHWPEGETYYAPILKKYNTGSAIGATAETLQKAIDKLLMEGKE